MTPRRFRSSRTIGLSDVDAGGRLRLDAASQYLQDIASDDTMDAGWAPDSHFWVVRKTELEVVTPFRDDQAVEIETWASGIAAAAASRHYTLRARSGHIEAESVWIHLDAELRPLRLGERFLSVYGESAAAGPRPSTRLTLPAPAVAPSRDWPLRVTDIDRLGHVNNPAYYEPLEEVWAGRLDGRLRVVLEYRQPIDLGERVEIAEDGDAVWLVVGDEVRAAAILVPA